ncbi:MAG: hypothetical protein GX573_17490, partial [Chloroflexi bacterium]|nr:hypothetical protein [Chloroflexota bacterium]
LSAPAPGGAPGVAANIVSPAPGSTISIAQQLDIVGTASYEPGQALHYMVQIKGGQWPDWVVVHDIHAMSVTNGVLESIPPGGLPPGDYSLRVIVVGSDANWLATSYEVPFRVTS